MEGIEDEELHRRLKRKLYEADFESVESLKGLELEDTCTQRPERKRRDSDREKVSMVFTPWDFSKRALYFLGAICSPILISITNDDIGLVLTCASVPSLVREGWHLRLPKILVLPSFALRRKFVISF